MYFDRPPYCTHAANHDHLEGSLRTAKCITYTPLPNEESLYVFAVASTRSPKSQPSHKCITHVVDRGPCIQLT